MFAMSDKSTLGSLGYFSAKELGAAFRAERKALGRTQQWVADQCKFRRQTIADIESGKNTEVFTLMAALTTLGKGLAIIDRRIAFDQIGDLFNEED
jgi:DNA-binding XRE family transcriptional regulator